MKPHHPLLGLLLAATLASGPAAAAPTYRLTDLGTLGGTESDGMAIGRRGRIVGFSSTPGVDSHYRAFSFAHGRMKDLGGLSQQGESFAKAVNAQGTACGNAVAADFSAHAVVFAQGSVTDIHQLRTDWLGSDCLGINTSGQLVGFALSNQDYSYHAFVYSNGSFTVLEAGTIGSAINDSGQFVGSDFSHAFIVSQGVRTDLGTLGGSFSDASAINAAGQVTGWASTPGDAEQHAFVWQAGKLTDLGTLGGWQSRGMAINAAGTVAGWSYRHVLDTQHAFVTVGGVITDLNTLLDPVSGAGWELTVANGIDDQGRITGSGFRNGLFHAFLLTPIN